MGQQGIAEASALSIVIIRQRVPRLRAIVMLVTFCLATPVGIAIGMGIIASTPPPLSSLFAFFFSSPSAKHNG